MLSLSFIRGSSSANDVTSINELYKNYVGLTIFLGIILLLYQINFMSWHENENVFSHNFLKPMTILIYSHHFVSLIGRFRRNRSAISVVYKQLKCLNHYIGEKLRKSGSCESHTFSYNDFTV